MFNVLSFASIALAAVSSVSGLVVPRTNPPAGWKTDYLEPYTTYHVRYLALGCQNQHGKPFFDQCCHPLLATEKLETARPPQCVPSASASSSASAVEPTSTVTTPSDGFDDGCDDDEDTGDESSTAAAPTLTEAAPSDKSDKPAAAAAASPTTSTTPKDPPVAPKADKNADKNADKKPDEKPNEVNDDKPPADAPVASSSNLIQGGFATFFFQNGVAGACGTVHKDSDMIAAMNVERYGNTGTKSSLCGKRVKITNPANQKSVTVIVADACPGCKNGNSIDLSQGAFNQIAKPEQGMVSIEWAYV